eukprot:3220461-Lingulodinium_polyedra.AAC.1
MAWHTEGYPGRMALLLSEEEGDVAGFLDRLQQDHEAHKVAEQLAPKVTFLRSALRPSFFRTTVGQELAALLLQGPLGASKQAEVLQEAKVTAQDYFGGWGQTKVVEDNFHVLRQHETRGSDSQSLSLARQ